jgi:polyisoprenoid-binding protein YceI
MKMKLLVPTLLLGSLGFAWAAPIEFDFKDPKGVNNIVFKTDAPLESINGTGTDISGRVLFDPENPGAVRGKIVLAVNSLHVPNPRMREHLHGADWMDEAKYPQIIFEVGETKNVKTNGDNTTADVLGKITIKGTTRELTVPVRLTYLKGQMKARQGRDGDLLVLRSNFVVKRSDFGINAGKNEDKVSDEIDLSLSLAGSAPRK